VVVALAGVFAVGATVQGLVGIGLGLVAAPLTTLLQPELMPQLPLWLALFMPFVTLVRDHDLIDWHGLGWALAARVPGTAIGVALVGWFSTRGLGIVVGLMVLLGVLATIRAVVVPVHKGSLLAAGFVSGITGTLTSIGGPPLAILYQHRDPAQIRSTLAIYFLLGAALSLGGLGLSGGLEARTLLIAGLMAPFLVLGFGLSRLLHRVVPASHIRSWVLLVCGLSALTLLARSLFG